jgi:hypothetical protein
VLEVPRCGTPENSDPIFCNPGHSANIAAYDGQHLEVSKQLSHWTDLQDTVTAATLRSSAFKPWPEFPNASQGGQSQDIPSFEVYSNLGNSGEPSSDTQNWTDTVVSNEL